MSELADVVRDVIADGNGRDPWEVLDELGLTTVGVSEAVGGSGGGPAELAEIVEAAAEQGAGLPLAEHALAVWAVGRSAAGIRLGTIAPVPGRTLGPGPVSVPWGESASHVVVAPLDGTPAFLLDLADCEVVPRDSDAAGRPFADVVPGPAEPVDCTVPGTEIMARLGALRATAIVGAARGAYRLTRAHVSTREQFGRPLVRIPAVATALARMRVDLVQAEAAAGHAVRGTGAGAGLVAAATGRVVCGAVASRVAAAAHQLHGALGVTREYGLHLYTRLLWALRDADLGEDGWAVLLGEHAVAGGEAVVWDELTAAGAAPG